MNLQTHGNVPLTTDYLGESLHTAVRKAMDSDISVVAYGYIGLIEQPWSSYLRILLRAIQEAPEDAALWQVVKNMSTTFTETLRAEQGHFLRPVGWTDRVYREARVLENIFRCFSEDDWRGYVAFVEDV